jgi:hypothetical protein
VPNLRIGPANALAVRESSIEGSPGECKEAFSVSQLHRPRPWRADVALTPLPNGTGWLAMLSPSGDVRRTEEEIMVLILIDTETGTRRTILVPVKNLPEPGAPAAVLSHPRFAVRA